MAGSIGIIVDPEYYKEYLLRHERKAMTKDRDALSKGLPLVTFKDKQEPLAPHIQHVGGVALLGQSSSALLAASANDPCGSTRRRCRCCGKKMKAAKLEPVDIA